MIEAAERSPKDIKTWIGPNGEVKNLRADQMPPEDFVPYSPKDESKEQAKTLQRLEDDIQQNEQKMAGLMSGQDIADAALGSDRPKAIAMLSQQRGRFIEQYKKLGGKRDYSMNVKPEPDKEEPKQKSGVVSKKIKKEFSELPPPADYKDIVITDTETGKKLKSNGKEWVELK